ARGGGESVGVVHARLRGGTAARLVLALFHLREVGRGRRQGRGGGIGAGAITLPGAEKKRQACAKQNQRDQLRTARGVWLRRWSGQCWDNATAVLVTIWVQASYVRSRPRQKLIVERAPNTAAFGTAPLPASSGTLPPGCQKYWKSGCTVHPEASCIV